MLVFIFNNKEIRNLNLHNYGYLSYFRFSFSVPGLMDSGPTLGGGPGGKIKFKPSNVFYETECLAMHVNLSCDCMV